MACTFVVITISLPHWRPYFPLLPINRLAFPPPRLALRCELRVRVYCHYGTRFTATTALYCHLGTSSLPLRLSTATTAHLLPEPLHLLPELALARLALRRFRGPR